MRYLAVIAASLAVSSSALAEIPANEAQIECTTMAYKAYLAKLKQGMTAQGSSIANVVAQRRLMEGYCVQFVQCLDYSTSVQGTKFQNCLDDEDADRLHDANE